MWVRIHKLLPTGEISGSVWGARSKALGERSTKSWLWELSSEKITFDQSVFWCCKHHWTLWFFWPCVKLIPGIPTFLSSPSFFNSLCIVLKDTSGEPLWSRSSFKNPAPAFLFRITICLRRWRSVFAIIVGLPLPCCLCIPFPLYNVPNNTIACWKRHSCFFSDKIDGFYIPLSYKSCMSILPSIPIKGAVSVCLSVCYVSPVYNGRGLSEMYVINAYTYQ